MSMKKWIPWNWFKKEEEDVGKGVPIQHTTVRQRESDLGSSIAQLHREFDRLF